MREILRLKWRRAPEYKIDTVHGTGKNFSLPLTANLPPGRYVRPRGRNRSYRITGSDCGTKRREGTGLDVMLDLANAKSNAQGVLQFAQKWGLLTDSEPQLSAFTSTIKRFNQALFNVWMGENEKTWALINLAAPFIRSTIAIEDDVIYQDCQSLGGFCWLELLACIKRGVEFRMCCVCKEFYPGQRSPRLRQGSRVRQGSYCDNPKCKLTYYTPAYREQSKRDLARAAELAKELVRELEAEGAAPRPR